MIYEVDSNQGFVKVDGLTFKLDSDFRGGTYVICCKDVTKGLPARMRMETTKILLKLEDKDEVEVEKVDPKAAKGKKK